MKSRFKTFGEFNAGITVAYSKNGCTIICKLKNFVMLDVKFKPWNTPKTREIFLAKMYMREVLEKHTISNKITRIPGFELLGKRCLYKDMLSIVCNSVDMVNPDTGEMTKKLTVFNSTISHPFKVFIDNVQI